MEYLEERALVVRDRRGGVDRDEPARWESVVASRTGSIVTVSRTCTTTSSSAHGPPDVGHVLDARALYAHARAADALYRASLRHELAERTPWSAWRSFEGVERVVGLDEGYRALWAGHHARSRREADVESRRDAPVVGARPRAIRALGNGARRPRGREVLDEHRFAGAFEGRLDVSRVATSSRRGRTRRRFGQDPRALTRSGRRALSRARARSRRVHEPAIPVREARMIPPCANAGRARSSAISWRVARAIASTVSLARAVARGKGGISGPCTRASARPTSGGSARRVRGRSRLDPGRARSV